MKVLLFILVFASAAFGQVSSGFNLNTGLPPGKLYLDSSASGIVYVDTSGEKQSAGTFWQYKARTTDTTGYPNNGYMLWDRTIQINADSLVFSHLTTDGIDIDVFLSQLASGNHLLIQDANTSNNYQMWQVSGTPKNYNFGTATSYWKVRVILDSSAGTGTTGFANNHQLFVVRFTGGGTSGVTSVAISGTNGLNVISGSPITTSGTIALGITNKSIADSSIHDTTITYNKLQHNSLVDYLLGATTAYHDVQPIKLGTNLSMSNDTINSTNTGGTVTTFSATGHNGISTSVSNPTTTPALTIGITNGSIGDSSLASTFLKTNQTITLSGDVSGSGATAITTTIGTNAVTYAKMQAVSTTSKLLGSSSTTTPVQEITLGTNLSLSGTTLNATGASSSSIIDLSSPASQIVKDSLISGSGVTIHATTEPTTPQLIYVVKAADIPTNTNVASYMAIMDVFGKNRDAGTNRTLNWQGSRGSVKFSSTTNNTVTNNQFWHNAFIFNSKPVAVGDTLSVFFWCTFADTIDYRGFTLYIVPRELSPVAGTTYFYGQTNSTTSVPWDWNTALTGANAGVSYTDMTNQPQWVFVDTATASNVIATPLTQTIAQVHFTIQNGQHLLCGTSGSFTADIQAGFFASVAAATLYRLPASNGTARRIKYFRKIQ